MRKYIFDIIFSIILFLDCIILFIMAKEIGNIIPVFIIIFMWVGLFLTKKNIIKNKKNASYRIIVNPNYFNDNKEYNEFGKRMFYLVYYLFISFFTLIPIIGIIYSFLVD